MPGSDGTDSLDGGSMTGRGAALAVPVYVPTLNSEHELNYLKGQAATPVRYP